MRDVNTSTAPRTASWRSVKTTLLNITQRAYDSSSRGSGTMCCSLSACRRLQAVVLLVIVTAYLHSIANALRHTSTTDSRRHCLQQTCVYKCCPQQEAFQSEYNHSCVTHSNTTSFIFIETVSTLLNQSRDVCFHDNSSVLVFSNRCGSVTPIKGRVALQDDIVLIEDGLHVSCVSACFEFVADSDSLVIAGCVEEVVSDESDHTYTKVKEVILLTSSAISTVAFVIVMVTYACLPKLRNLQGKLLICYLIPMTLFNLNFMMVVVIPGPWLTSGVFVLVERLNTLFLFGWLTWLTLMCHDIWSTFSRPLQSVDARCGHSDRRKFFFYSLIGWGYPAVHVVALDVFAHDLPNIKRSVVDNFTCTAIMLNLIMFLSTLVNMSLHHSSYARPDPRHSRRHRPASSASSTTMEGVLLYLKLALLMGTVWSTVLVSLSLPSDTLYDLSLLLVELQGVFLFFLLICNRRVRTLLVKRWEGISRTETSSSA